MLLSNHSVKWCCSPSTPSSDVALQALRQVLLLPKHSVKCCCSPSTPLSHVAPQAIRQVMLLSKHSIKWCCSPSTPLSHVAPQALRQVMLLSKHSIKWCCSPSTRNTSRTILHHNVWLLKAIFIATQVALFSKPTAVLGCWYCWYSYCCCWYWYWKALEKWQMYGLFWK